MKMFKPYPGAIINSAHPLAQGLVLCSVMNERTGGYVNDYSRNDNNGTLINMDADNWVASPNGGGLQFNSSGSEYATFGQKNSLDLNALTISFWVKGGSQPDDYANITSKALVNTRGWYVGTDNLGPNIVLRIDTSAQINQLTTMTGILDDTWHHVLWTIDNGVIEGFKDGISVSNDTYNVGTGLIIATDLLIAKRSNNTNYFTGYLDSLLIHNRVLTSNEVMQLKDNTYAMFERPSPARLMFHPSVLAYERHTPVGTPLGMMRGII
jgi:hypothetical protein